MTTLTEVTALSAPVPVAPPTDHRGSWIPTPAMIGKRHMELRRRRGLMITLAAVTIGLPTVYLVIRLLLRAFDPKTYGPAGGYDTFTGLVAGVLYVFGFIVAATLGCTAGAVDLQEGVFRHLVVTGRSRLAIYFARIPAGLGIIVPLIATGYAIVCIVCCFAAPARLNYDGATVPAGLSRPALVAWADHHEGEVLCNFGLRVKGPGAPGAIPIACGRNGNYTPNALPPGVPRPTAAQLKAAVNASVDQNYSDYAKNFLSPPVGLMIRTGLWLLLEAAIGLTVGLGLSSLIGQRTVAVILMIVLEVILTPLFLRAHIPHMINVQRAVVGVATAHLSPSALPIAFGGGPSDQSQIVSETRWEAVIAVIGWLVVWTGLGAWRMAKRDA